MSSNFERLHKIKNQAYAENFSIITQIMANPLLYPSLHFLIGIPFQKYSSVRTEKLHFILFFILKKFIYKA
jgi:hypothetical protein